MIAAIILSGFLVAAVSVGFCIHYKVPPNTEVIQGAAILLIVVVGGLSWLFHKP